MASGKVGMGLNLNVPYEIFMTSISHISLYVAPTSKGFFVLWMLPIHEWLISAGNHHAGKILRRVRFGCWWWLVWMRPSCTVHRMKDNFVWFFSSKLSSAILFYANLGVFSWDSSRNFHPRSIFPQQNDYARQTPVKKPKNQAIWKKLIFFDKNPLLDF